ncbi:MAG: class I SAM-dependent methyltransferase [Sphingomonas sp.]|nr:class I SAM-dependent methyltransferase [Sphingomonas sp.]
MNATSVQVPGETSASVPRRTFDRTSDISKLDGYTSSGVEHRWTIYAPFLDLIPPGSPALDFGCGSLCESFALVSRGIDVTSVDLDPSTMASYRDNYVWPRPLRLLTFAQVADGKLSDDTFRLICSFDVLEHVEEPGALLAMFERHLTNDGLLFLSVPNRFALVEILSWAWWRLGLLRGRVFVPGEPHIQFKSPQEWRRLIEANGTLEVVAHEMAMGFFVITWSAVVGLPARAIDSIIRRQFGRRTAVEGAVLHPRLMKCFSWLDRRMPRRMGVLSGSNLFVARRRAASASRP